jgi:SAM-dependent methyltransferase
MGWNAPMSDYVLNEREQPRLAAQAERLDAVTFRHLDEVGVGPGWRCLEVGGGTGSVARWLQQRVGGDGHVTVTDIEIRWLEPLAAPNLAVRRHDIVTDPLDPTGYDLIHIRLVLMHLPDLDAVLDKLIASVRPGGWLVVEEADWHATVICQPPSATWTKVLGAASAALQSAGQDLAAGRRIPAALTAAGLVDLAAEGTLFPMRAVELGGYVLPLIDRVRDTLAGVDAAELAEVLDELTDERSGRWAYSPMLVSTRARRPGA